MHIKKGNNMPINNYQISQNPSFGAKFVSNVKDLDIDTKKVGAAFEELTNDFPNETLVLDKQYTWGEVGDIFTLKDNQNNKLARIACSFTTHSKIDETPENQASLLNNIFRFMKERASENTALKEIYNKMNDLKKQMNDLVEQEKIILKRRNEKILANAGKYDIEISELNAKNPDFTRIYKTAQYTLSLKD